MSGSGFSNDVMHAENVDFSGGFPVSGQITSDGQLLIGSAASPNIRPGFLTSLDGSITVTNGAGTINIAGSAQGFQPNAVVQIFDDFIGLSTNSNGPNGQLPWGTLGTSLNVTSGTVDHPGILNIPAVAANTFGLILTEQDNNARNAIIPGGGLLSISWVARINTLSAGVNTYRLNLGIGDANTLYSGSDSFVNGIYFSYTDTVNSGNWVINCTKASVTTSVNTNVAADTNFHTFTLAVNAGATSVSFYIDNVIVGSAIVTNIPVSGMCPFILGVRTAGTTTSIDVDLFWLVLQLANPRPGPLAGIIPANLRSIENYTQTATSYQVLGTDAIVGVTSTAAARTITMPIVGTQAGQIWTIKDESGACSVNNITIAGNGFNIDGSANYVLNTNYGSVEIYFSGSAFYVR